MNEPTVHIPDFQSWTGAEMIQALTAMDDIVHSITAAAETISACGKWIHFADMDLAKFRAVIAQSNEDDPDSVRRYAETIRFLRAVSDMYLGSVEDIFVELDIILPSTAEVPDTIEELEGS